MLRRSPVNREPYTTRALPAQHRRDQLRPVLGVVLEVGVLDRARSRRSRRSRPVRTAAPLPRLSLVQDDAHGAVAELAQHVAGAVGAAVVDHDDLALDAVGELDRAHAPQRSRRTRVALVEDGHDHRELAQLRRRRGHARPRARSSRYQACVRSRPSRSSIFGSQPSSSRARVMSGWRRVGSPIGSGSNTSSDVEPATSQHELGQLEHRELVRVADVDRIDDVGVEQREDPAHFVVDVAERTGLRARRRRS